MHNMAHRIHTAAECSTSVTCFYLILTCCLLLLLILFALLFFFFGQDLGIYSHYPWTQDLPALASWELGFQAWADTVLSQLWPNLSSNSWSALPHPLQHIRFSLCFITTRLWTFTKFWNHSFKIKKSKNIHCPLNNQNCRKLSQKGGGFSLSLFPSLYLSISPPLASSTPPPPDLSLGTLSRIGPKRESCSWDSFFLPFALKGLGYTVYLTHSHQVKMFGLYFSQ